MAAATALIATVEADHTIRLPLHLLVGEQVLVVRMPSISALLSDKERRARFAATRKALQAAVQNPPVAQAPSNEEIAQLVKRARRATRTQP